MTGKRLNRHPTASHAALSRFADTHHPTWMRASPRCHDLPLQPAHAVVLKFLHGLYVLVALEPTSRVHLLRILAQHPAHGAWQTTKATASASRVATDGTPLWRE